jgi:signal transduction histidine kinase
MRTRLAALTPAVVLVDDAARTAAAVRPPPLSPADPVEIPATSDGAVISVYAPDGTRVAGSGPPMADSVTRNALAGRVASKSAGGEVVAAVPVGSQEQVVAVVRAALPVAVVDDRVHHAWLVMGAIELTAVLLAGAVAVLQARRLSRPLEDLTAAAVRMGEGDFSAHVDASGIDEIDSIGQAMNATSRRLASVLERERAFSADASHQLRTPLTALRIRLESALLSTESDPRSVMAGSLQEIDRLQQMVEDLLRLTRDVPGDRRPLQVAAIIDELDARWHKQLAAGGVRLSVSIPAVLPVLAVSTSAVGQILDVLVDNAFHHGRGPIQVMAREIAGGVAIDVADHGAGIAGDAQRIFERRAAGTAGHGIGLALARALTEAEGGRLFLLRSGTNPVFRLVLPVHAAALTS